MPWRKLNAAQVVLLVPIIIKCLAWLFLLTASITKMLGYHEVATVLTAIASTLGVVDANNDLKEVKSD